MRILKAKAQNFCSFAEIEFDYSNQGLALISGPTGAGKSTVLDLPSWILYGITSKDSAVDDVRSWNAEGVTLGVVQIEALSGNYEITRIRGSKPSQNDLYYNEIGSEVPIRGKDLVDTQKQIISLLGISSELYNTASYFHQFSKADSFFIAKAKERRETLEMIAELSLPIKLSESSSEARKETKKLLVIEENILAKEEGRLEQLLNIKEDLKNLSIVWEQNRSLCLEELHNKAEYFDQEKEEKKQKHLVSIEELKNSIIEVEKETSQIEYIEAQLKDLEDVKDQWSKSEAKVAVAGHSISSLQSQFDDLLKVAQSSRCPTCLGATETNLDLTERLVQLNDKIEESKLALSQQTLTSKTYLVQLQLENRLKSKHEELKDKKASIRRIRDQIESKNRELSLLDTHNHYEDEIAQLKAAVNPHWDQLTKNQELIDKLANSTIVLSQKVQELEHKIVSLTWLYDKSFELRGILLSNAVLEIETQTNYYLEKHFDAEIRVKFTLENSDKLEVEIQKGGNACPFKQLSGGQRGLLKLAFSASVMKSAANKAGVHFSMLCFDEALNGLDDDLKTKAFGLFQELELDHESIFLVDHCEPLKSLFNNKYSVILSGDNSIITYEQD